MNTFLSRFFIDEDAATSIEYAIMAAGIAVAIVATVNALGVTVLTTKFQAVTTAMQP